MYVDKNTDMYVSVYTYVYRCVYTHRYVFFAYAYMRIYIYIHAHTYACNTYIHICGASFLDHSSYAAGVKRLCSRQPSKPAAGADQEASAGCIEKTLDHQRVTQGVDYPVTMPYREFPTGPYKRLRKLRVHLRSSTHPESYT